MKWTYLLKLFLLFILIISVVLFLTWINGDLHFANRLGALVSAFAGLLVIFQVKREISFEHQRSEDVAVLDGEKVAPVNLPLAEGIVKSREQTRSEKRLKTVSVISTILVAGELLHGWGDLLLKLILSVLGYDYTH